MWRQVRVPDQITLQDLHAVIQAVMGWEDKHLWEFRRGGDAVGPDPEDAEARDPRSVTLADWCASDEPLEYVYDFGDDWVHRLEVTPATEGSGLELLDGEEVCPPEDCGGASGHSRLLRALRDPRHPDHRSAKDWTGTDPLIPWQPDIARARLTKLTKAR